MSSTIREQAAHEIASVLPQRAHDLARLQILSDDSEPVVTVVGKYNHGKSSLLNELLGRDAFAVSDRRETVRLSDSVHDGVRWLDAPGLDADVGSADDREALRAAWLKSDIRLFVHAAKEGELDAKELTLLAELDADRVRTGRQTLVVLSQVDQLADDAELQNVGAAIDRQMPGIVLNAVSSMRHRKGIEGGKKLLLEKSGIPALQAMLQTELARVPAARAHERALLLREIGAQLQQLRAAQQTSLGILQKTQQQQRREFDRDLSSVIEKVARDIDAMLNALGTDHAIVPDTAKDAYMITAGKLERAHIQIAYSRACIEIDAVLAAHGVIAIPLEQRTVAKSLNSVMIAVMGVSVKLRKDLRRMFCEASGRERMQREFIHYYELSDERKALAAQIADTEASIAASAQAALALRTLEARA
ncbi:50S ribosome-binding GTPase [Paraburkholderia sp. MMS20-SJTR3]|uniref:50S ribosome-binding GTPase n=1 Tax=Paraburkholderia sejongensis TaxID=2886946 RepID=A0ABS8JZ20_9BURK|nr:GTPase [Paraburkholderia sp. MMS20-SJTR3]MCC8395153.1 50S ribosome-binding GTPase [Paraburkholderia sp. MMS20-SJTR3]